MSDLKGEREGMKNKRKSHCIADTVFQDTVIFGCEKKPIVCLTLVGIYSRLSLVLLPVYRSVHFLLTYSLGNDNFH